MCSGDFVDGHTAMPRLASKYPIIPQCLQTCTCVYAANTRTTALQPHAHCTAVSMLARQGLVLRKAQQRIMSGMHGRGNRTAPPTVNSSEDIIKRSSSSIDAP